MHSWDFPHRESSTTIVRQVERGAVLRDAGAVGEGDLAAGHAARRPRDLLRLLEVSWLIHSSLIH